MTTCIGWVSVAQYLCVLTVVLFAGSEATLEDKIEQTEFLDDVETTILAHIESQLVDVKESLARLERLHVLETPLEDLYEGRKLNALLGDRPDYDKRSLNTDAFHGVRGRRHHDSAIDEARQQLLDYIAMYSRSHSSDVTSDVPSKRQPPTGFHAIRGRRSDKEPIRDTDQKYARRAAFFKGFSAVRGR